MCITPPASYDSDTKGWVESRAADGFAFVLHLDGGGVHARGSAGVQLGYGGMANCLAVQFCTTPSCASHRKSREAKGAQEEDGRGGGFGSLWFVFRLRDERVGGV